MQEAAKLELLKIDQGQSNKPVRSEKMTPLKSVILYETEGEKNLLDITYLKEIEELEKDITSMQEWNDLCWAKSVDDKSCNDNAMVSALQFLRDHGVTEVKKTTQDKINEIFSKMLNDDALWNKYAGMFNHKEQILREGRVKYMRSFMEFGAPLFIDE